MASCCFLGEMTNEELTEEVAVRLYDIFEKFIIENEVSVFYTTGKTNFESICESMLMAMQDRFKRISIVRLAEADENPPGEDISPYELWLNNESDLTCCQEAIRLSKYIILARKSTEIPKMPFLEAIFFDAYTKNKFVIPLIEEE